VNSVLIPTIRFMPEREAVSLELDVEVVAMIREFAEAGHVREGEVIERAIPLCRSARAGRSAPQS
jgi:hypothetical protein